MMDVHTYRDGDTCWAQGWIHHHWLKQHISAANTAVSLWGDFRQTVQTVARCPQYKHSPREGSKVKS